MLSQEMAALPIIDPHFHLWDLENGSYPWLMTEPHWDGIAGDTSSIATTYLWDDYLADQGRWRVSGAVHVEAAYDRRDPVAETRWLQSVADSHRLPMGIVASAVLQDPLVEDLIVRHKAYRNLRGIRHCINWHANPQKTVVDRPDLLNDSSWLHGFALLQKYDLSFDLQLYPSQMHDAAGVAARHGGTTIILDHAGMPVDRDPSSMAMWHQGMKELSAEPNVSVKLSGLGMTDWRWTTASIRPFILTTIDYFGVDRCMFASNFPVDRIYSSFERLYDSFAEIVADFTHQEQTALFGGTAARVYRLGLPITSEMHP